MCRNGCIFINSVQQQCFCITVSWQVEQECQKWSKSVKSGARVSKVEKECQKRWLKSTKCKSRSGKFKFFNPVDFISILDDYSLHTIIMFSFSMVITISEPHVQDFLHENKVLRRPTICKKEAKYYKTKALVA